MGSALTPRGSTARWRKLRQLVLDRDGWTCRVPDEHGVVCGVRLTTHDPKLPTHATVDHITARAELAQLADADTPANLRAACRACNGRRAAELTNRRRVVSPRRW